MGKSIVLKNQNFKNTFSLPKSSLLTKGKLVLDDNNGLVFDDTYYFNIPKENKIKVQKKIIFPDHYNYKFSDLKKIKKIASLNNLKIITTEKDFMKIGKFKDNKFKFTNVDLKIEEKIQFKNFLLKKL